MLIGILLPVACIIPKPVVTVISVLLTALIVPHMIKDWKNGDYDLAVAGGLQMMVDKDENLIAQYEYTLGKGGERTKVKETGLGETVTTSYEYDEAGRLTQEIISKGEDKTTYGYVYDKVGNRTEKWEKGTATKYTYNSRNQLIKEETLEGAVVYSYDANGNLLNQAGNGKAISYQYDEYNRLIQYSEGEKKETYTYDAEGVRRTKENGTKTIYYVSDTTGSLSYTLAETDEVGETLAAYTRADTLISQIRGEESSYYLYDGHGDVRGLLDTEGTITDTYRYNAYGELLEQTGNTENHYRYTGEYYDSTSNLYYLRARYMNPSTGTFISMDSYQGSIYDPDTLHKYLYANGNPVKYSDPSGNFFAAASVMISSTMNTLASNSNTLHLMGLVSGISNAAITSFLGGSDKEVEKAFIKGYIMGVGLGALHIVVAAYSVIAFASLIFAESVANTAMMLTMTVYSITSHRDKETIVYTVLTILSIIGLYQSYKFYGSLTVIGDKGSVKIDFDNSNPNNCTIDGKRIGINSGNLLEMKLQFFADGESGKETELFLPDEYYQNLNKDIQNGYQTPNTREVYKRLGNTSHEVETSIVISDEFGRIKYRIDYSTHGNNLAHTNPHIHEFVPNLTKANDYPSEIRYFFDSNTGKIRIGKSNNDGTYNWLD